MLRDGVRAVAWVICSVLLVLLVPSSAWSDDTGSPASLPSSSPSDGSSSDAPSEPTTTPAPESPATSSPPAEPQTPSEGADVTTPAPAEPTVTETVTVEPEPSTMVASTEADPAVVRLDNETTALLLLGTCLMAVCLGVITITSFRS